MEKSQSQTQLLSVNEPLHYIFYSLHRRYGGGFNIDPVLIPIIIILLLLLLLLLLLCCLWCWFAAAK